MLSASPAPRTSTCTRAAVCGEKDRRLARRVAATHDDHLFAAAELRPP